MDRMRNSSSLKQSAVDVMITELAQSKREEAETKELFTNATVLVRTEIERYRKEQDEDLTAFIDQFVEVQITMAQRVCDGLSLIKCF